MIRFGATTAILSVAVLLTVRDLSRTGIQETEGDFVEAGNSIQEPKMKSRFMGPTLRVLYCFSWGYRRVFEEYAQAIRQRYPSLSIEGDNFPPPPWKALIAQVLSFAKIGLIIMIVLGHNPFPMLGIETPNAFSWALQNKLYACMMLFFISNAIEGQLISTGAFEVSFNDVPVWSKMENGRVPSPQELFQIIDSQIRMSGSGDTNRVEV